jgi:hypothetical protein
LCRSSRPRATGRVDAVISARAVRPLARRIRSQGHSRPFRHEESACPPLATPNRFPSGFLLRSQHGTRNFLQLPSGRPSDRTNYLLRPRAVKIRRSACDRVVARDNVSTAAVIPVSMK